MTDLIIVATYSAFLSELKVRHVLGGSLASSAWGEQRNTNDADFLLDIAAEQVAEYLARLPNGYFVDSVTVGQALADTQPFASFQSLFEPTAFKIDNFIARSPWDNQQIERARLLPLQLGVQVPVASPEDMIIAKCRRFDLGNRVSDRQWHDLVRLYEVQRENLDVPYIEKWLSHFGLMDLWVEIRRQAKV